MKITKWTALLVGASCAALAAAPPAPQGVITARAFTGIGGTSVADLTNSTKFINNQPDVVTYLPYFEWNATGDIYTPPGDWGDNYGVQIVGYFYPPSDGEYWFYICSDDQSVLYLSTDEDPENKKLIAMNPNWNNPRDYEGTAQRNPDNPENCSATFLGTEWPERDPMMGGAKIELEAGKAYYIEALMKEGGGGDNLSVAVFDMSGVIPSMPGALIPIPGEYLATIDKSSGPPTITTQPQSQTVNEGESVTFTVEVDGTPPYTYQWYRDGNPIPDATNATYTIPFALATDDGAKFKVEVSNNLGKVTSEEVVLNVIADTEPPTVVDIGSDRPNRIFIVFSEPVDQTSAENSANYQIQGGPNIASAVLKPDQRTVLLQTATPMPEGQWYTLVINNIKDLAAAGNTIAPNSEIQFRSAVFVRGFVVHKKFEGFDDNAGVDPTNLFLNPRYPDQPDRIELLTAVEYPPNGAYRDSTKDPNRNYFDIIEGYFIPPQTGEYVFFTAGADRWWLFLSTNEDPANIHMIAGDPADWADPRAWNISNQQDPARHRSDLSPFNTWPTAPTIRLTEGQKYYLLMVHHDPSWAGGDWFDATYKLEGEPDPANGTPPRLTGDVIGTYIDATDSAITILKQPEDVTVTEGQIARFRIEVTGTSSYGDTVLLQWQRAEPGSDEFVDIPGAVYATYETPLLKLADNGARYRVVCAVPGLTKVSEAATLTVVPDTQPPQVVGVGSILKNGAVEIGVEFDEDVDPTTASDPANYVLSKGSVTNVRYQRFAHADGTSELVLGSNGPFYGCAVVLETSGLSPGDQVTVTVKNVKDLKGNAIPSSGLSKTLTISGKFQWAAMGGNDYLEGNTADQNINPDPTLWPDDVVAVGPNDFFLISSSSANWDVYDEATFVYEKVTGDFDKVVRIEFQDPASHWARAGICVTPSADEGVTRADVTGGAQMERRFLVRANPTIRWDGAVANNSFEAAWRLTKGGTYSAAASGTPVYPTAWVRVKRQGQTFTAYYSNDGVNWTQITSVTFNEEPVPDTLLVGPYYAPELNNNQSAQGIGHSVVAKFRDYGDYQKPAPTLSIHMNEQGQIVLTFEGTLQEADEVTGPYVDVTDQSPYVVTPKAKQKYYRARW